MVYNMKKDVSVLNDLVDGPLAASYGNPWSTHYYVDNVGGSSGGTGLTPDEAKNTIALGAALMSAGDVLHVRGTGTDYSENVSITADNVTLVGHNFGVECGGWTPAAQNGTILTLSGAKGARVTGFLFRGNGTTGVGIDISETVSNDSDNITIDHNIFKSTTQDVGSHILANGCPGYIKIYHNHFTWGVTAINCTTCPTTSATGWEIKNNYFSDKITNGVYVPLRRSIIKYNDFSSMTICVSTVGYSATNGDYNDVNENNFFETGTHSSITKSQTNDSWQGNMHNFALNTAIGGG